MARSCYNIQIGATDTAQTIAALSRVMARFGIPRQVVTDNRPLFVLKAFREFCKLIRILHFRNPPYHPKCSGQAERFIQSFKKTFKKTFKGLEE